MSQLDLEAIRRALAALPHIEEGEAPEEGLLSITEEFAKLLRKVAVQRSRIDTELLAKVEAAGRRIEEVHDAALAERKRSLEAENQSEQLAHTLIAQLDLIERAVDVMSEASGLESWAAELRRGAELTLEAARGAALIDTGREGEPFDPRLHEPAGEIPAENKRLVVKSVLKRGFTLNGRVLRTAEVQLEHQDTTSGGDPTWDVSSE